MRMDSTRLNQVQLRLIQGLEEYVMRIRSSNYGYIAPRSTCLCFLLGTLAAGCGFGEVTEVSQSWPSPKNRSRIDQVVRMGGGAAGYIVYEFRITQQGSNSTSGAAFANAHDQPRNVHVNWKSEREFELKFSVARPENAKVKPCVVIDDVEYTGSVTITR